MSRFYFAHFCSITSHLTFLWIYLVCLSFNLSALYKLWLVVLYLQVTKANSNVGELGAIANNMTHEYEMLAQQSKGAAASSNPDVSLQLGWCRFYYESWQYTREMPHFRLTWIHQVFFSGCFMFKSIGKWSFVHVLEIFQVFEQQWVASLIPYN